MPKSKLKTGSGGRAESLIRINGGGPSRGVGHKRTDLDVDGAFLRLDVFQTPHAPRNHMTRAYFLGDTPKGTAGRGREKKTSRQFATNVTFWLKPCGLEG